MNTSKLENVIRKIISELSNQKGYIGSVDVLIKLNYLSQKDYDDWRAGKIEYLEKVCKTNLHKLSTINRIIRQISNQMNLKPSWTSYNKYGKGPKQKLRFSKSGNEIIENAYSTHFVNELQINKLKENKNIITQPNEPISHL